MAMIPLTVNGRRQTVDVDPATPLLYVLNDDLELRGPKFGCGLGQCGACTVIVRGRAVRSCQTPVNTVSGAEITTLEGLGSPEAMSPIQTAFHEHYAAQCGFCTSGMVLAAHGYLEGGGSSERDSIQKALAGHVCRCTGYVKIIDAILAANAEREA